MASSYSGKFNVRITPEQHRRLADMAKRRGMSLNGAVSDAIDNWVSPSPLEDGTDPDEIAAQFFAAAELAARHLRRR